MLRSDTRQQQANESRRCVHLYYGMVRWDVHWWHAVCYSRLQSFKKSLELPTISGGHHCKPSNWVWQPLFRSQQQEMFVRNAESEPGKLKAIVQSMCRLATPLDSEVKKLWDENKPLKCTNEKIIAPCPGCTKSGFRFEIQKQNGSW